MATSLSVCRALAWTCRDTVLMNLPAAAAHVGASSSSRSRIRSRPLAHDREETPLAAITGAATDVSAMVMAGARLAATPGGPEDEAA